MFPHYFEKDTIASANVGSACLQMRRQAHCFANFNELLQASFLVL